MSDIFFVAAMYFFLRQNEAVNTDVRRSLMARAPRTTSPVVATLRSRWHTQMQRKTQFVVCRFLSPSVVVLFKASAGLA
jgi:hypothetical protein